MAEQAKTSDMTQELRDIMRHAEALLEATAGEVDDKIKQARESLGTCLTEAKQHYASAGDSLRETVEATDRFIHAKPYHAVGGSFLVGLLLGWLMRGK